MQLLLLALLIGCLQPEGSCVESRSPSVAAAELRSRISIRLVSGSKIVEVVSVAPPAELRIVVLSRGSYSSCVAFHVQLLPPPLPPPPPPSESSRNAGATCVHS